MRIHFAFKKLNPLQEFLLTINDTPGGNVLCGRVTGRHREAGR